MDKVQTKDLLEFFFHTSNSMQTFWSFYITVVLGIIAFFGSVKSPTRQLAIIMTVAFLVFAIVNLDGLQDITYQRLAAARKIKESIDPLAVLYKDSIRPPEFWLVALTHTILDVSTIISLWILVLKQKRL